MNLKINGINIEVTEALRDYISGKLERIVRHSDNVISATVTLSVDKLKQKWIGIWPAKTCTSTKPTKICTPPSTSW